MVSVARTARRRQAVGKHGRHSAWLRGNRSCGQHKIKRNRPSKQRSAGEGTQPRLSPKQTNNDCSPTVAKTWEAFPPSRMWGWPCLRYASSPRRLARLPSAPHLAGRQREGMGGGSEDEGGPQEPTSAHGQKTGKKRGGKGQLTTIVRSILRVCRYLYSISN